MWIQNNIEMQEHLIKGEFGNIHPCILTMFESQFCCMHVGNATDCHAAKRSVGVTREINLRNSWHAGDKARKRGIHPAFETQGRGGTSPEVQNRGISSSTKRTHVLQKFLKKN